MVIFVKDAKFWVLKQQRLLKSEAFLPSLSLSIFFFQIVLSYQVAFKMLSTTNFVFKCSSTLLYKSGQQTQTPDHSIFGCLDVPDNIHASCVCNLELLGQY